MPLTKVIVTIRQVLQNKYGPNFQSLQHEINRLVADPRFKTTLVYLDDAMTMVKYGRGAIPLTNGQAAEKDCKDWIDNVFSREEPHYLVLFGCQDIVPFQRFPNPMFNQHFDTDREVPSDLPYASNSPYSQNIADFINPSRVVGRIPDLLSTNDVNHVRQQVDFILGYVPRPLAQYKNYIGLAAQVWSASTDQSLRNIFGINTNQKDYPPTTNPPAPNLQPLTHFINCHGALQSVIFQGESSPPKRYPTALHTNNITGILPGTIVAAECCYGTHVHRPFGIQMSIASAYMENKAAVFMGSSSIAFGEPALNDQADIICQDFLKKVLAGASTGRALLEARQRYIYVKGPLLSSVDAKTIAQFYILGDPSVQPVVQVLDAESLIKNRRLTMKMKGISLGSTTLIAEKVENAPRPENLNAAIKSILDENQFPDMKEDVFQAPRTDLEIMDLHLKSIRFRIFGARGSSSEDPDDAGISNFRILMVKEDGRDILETRVYDAK
jgi:hypothetical protein